MANFGDILNRPAATIVHKPPYPTGSYILQVGQFKEIEVGKNKTPALDFDCKILDLMPDVDEAGYIDPSGKPLPLRGQPYRLRFFVSEDSAWRLKDFLTEALKISDDAGNKTLRQMLAEAPTRGCVVYNKHRASDDGKQVFTEQGNVTALPT